MILGIGTDLVEIARFEALLSRHGERAGRRILAPEECEAWVSASQPARFLAKRFAAKEAFAKAVGTGVREPVLLTAIRVGHDALGKPELAFGPALAGWLAERGVLRAHLSISDERSLCSAFVVLEG